MDLAIPIIVALQVGGNVVFFWGFFKILSLTVFKDNRESKEPDIEEEIAEVSRELERM
jgi:hypothetical protein